MTETQNEFETPPGASHFSDELRTKLSAAFAAKGPGYEARTELRTARGAPRFINRLILEDSPYLLQHAHNPVNWYTWGPEAFEAARREDKPIFLSIGYSTCHWCHVMEVESFDNVELATVLNERFIPIKVDREQRPDVDEIYMTAVLMTTGHGGWPMSSFLTPDAKPFFGGTYFPPRQFEALLVKVGELWKTQKDRLLSDADRMGKALAVAKASREKAEPVTEKTIDRAVGQIVGTHDDHWGGFGSAPKFPHEPELLLLLEAALRSGRKDALDAATQSLSAMARGGIYDQVGGGFARYSTDDRWLVPHFEKMLYNQAHLTRAYLDSFALTGDGLHARVARETLDYVLRDMTSPQGAFYSATDADSEGEEGLFFLWSPTELRSALSPEEVELALDLFQATERGNFEGKNILCLPVPLDVFARKRRLELPDVLKRLDQIREKLYQVRERRVHPLRDDKILTAWNAMMISAFVRGFEVLGDQRYLDAALRAAEFLWAKNRKAPGELWRVHLDGSSSVAATQEDYAYLCEALLALYDSTADSKWLDRAREIGDAMLARFWDADAGGFFISASNVDPHLIARLKTAHDGATPSGNSVAVRALARLSQRSGAPQYRMKAEETLAAFSSELARYPAGYAYMLLGGGDLLHGDAGKLRYAAGGAVRIDARFERIAAAEGRVRLEFALRDGWHINALQPLSKELIPTRVEIMEGRGSWRLGTVDAPEPKQVQLGFQSQPLAVYEGRFNLTAPVTWEEKEPGDPPVIAIRVRLQACDDRACQLPESVEIQLPVGPALDR